MLKQILGDAWNALLRNRTRSGLTMLGIVWGIVAVTMLIAYGEWLPHGTGKCVQLIWPFRGHRLAGAD